MTTVFFAPLDAFFEARVELPPDEARHAVKVLRHGRGDEIVVVDGAGGRHTVRLDVVERGKVIGEVIETTRDAGEPRFELSVGLGITKNAGRFETFVEKAVELGVGEIVPLVTERTEQHRIRRPRLEGIMVAAMKQSGRSRLPVLNEPRSLDDVLAASGSSLRIVCHEGAAAERSLPALLGDAGQPESAIILIGPEGGFSESEINAARGAGWHIASLGPRRLRAETAAILATGSIMLHYEG